jgi:hypothetical protein
VIATACHAHDQHHLCRKLPLQDNTAFATWWRAGQGLAPLSAEAAVRYVTSEDIRGPLGLPLLAALRAEVYTARCAGQLVGMATWLEGAYEDIPAPLCDARKPLSPVSDWVGALSGCPQSCHRRSLVTRTVEMTHAF